jgi:hypothetical protein
MGVIDFAVPVLLSLGLNVVFVIGTIEWELWGGGPSLLVQRNPIWVYPFVGGGLAFSILRLAQHLSRWRWAATLTALCFFALRGGLASIMSATGNVAPYLPPLFLLGAFLLDVISWERLAHPMPRTAATALTFTAGYGVLALPVLAIREHLPRFAPGDFAITLSALLAAALVLAPLTQWVSGVMLGQSASSPTSLEAAPASTR